jgi:hypothetical protein
MPEYWLLLRAGNLDYSIRDCLILERDAEDAVRRAEGAFA